MLTQTNNYQLIVRHQSLKPDNPHKRRLAGELITRNIGLIKQQAAKYNVSRDTFDELVSEGTIGLLRAIEKFDVNAGNKFSTYACFWIRNSS